MALEDVGEDDFPVIGSNKGSIGGTIIPINQMYPRERRS